MIILSAELQYKLVSWLLNRRDKYEIVCAGEEEREDKIEYYTGRGRERERGGERRGKIKSTDGH